jgi:ferredoxin
MDIDIDRRRCTGHGRCFSVAPEVFSPDEEGFGVVDIERVPGRLADAARRGAEACPEQAISLVAGGSGADPGEKVRSI